MRYIIWLILVMSTINLNGQDHLDMLSTAKNMTITTCDVQEKFTFSPCPYIKRDTIRYYYSSVPPVHDAQGVLDKMDHTIQHFFHKRLDSKVVKDSVNAHLRIDFEYVDGINGMLGKASYPNCDSFQLQTILIDNYDLEPGPCTPDSILIKYGDIKDIYVILIHELGHIVGKPHTDRRGDVMNATYPINDNNFTWSQAEMFDFEILFGGGMVQVVKGDSTRILKNFRFDEFFSKCEGVEQHFLDKRVLVVSQVLRDILDVPIRINSTYRDPICNAKLAGASSKSTHIQGLGFDTTILDEVYHDYVCDNIQEKGGIYDLLIMYGVRGFGLYDNHIHLDFRESEPVFWDFRGSLTTGACGL